MNYTSSQSYHTLTHWQSNRKRKKSGAVPWGFNNNYTSIPWGFNNKHVTIPWGFNNKRVAIPWASYSEDD